MVAIVEGVWDGGQSGGSEEGPGSTHNTNTCSNAAGAA